MKRLGLVFFLGCCVFLGSGCGERSCESGAQIKAPWDQLSLPVAEGGKVCFSYDNMLGIVHKASPIQLIQQYQKAFETSGWVVEAQETPAGSDMRFLKAVKGDKKLSISAGECQRFALAQYFSKCGLIQISEFKETL